MPERLILFDIDGTLLVTGGIGIRAMEQAGRDLFGEHFSAAGLEFAGGLDPLLLQALIERNRVAPAPDLHARFRARYHRVLADMLPGAPSARALPGVSDLLSALEARNHSVLGLLTGNFAETGRLKLAHCGIDPDRFAIAVWGDDSPHAPPCRDHLPPVALARCAAARGRPIHPARTAVIGDTPHDIRCAAASGCRSIAVATGKYSAAELAAAGADHVLPDLADTARVLDLLDSI